MPTVARINVTPVKSTALHHPASVELETTGPVGDRRFFFVDDAGERFGGDAKAPLMVVQASLEGERLALRFPDGRVVEGVARPDGTAISVDYLGEPVGAHLVGGTWSRDLSDHLGRSLHLAYLDEPATLVDEPVTIVSLASVEELGRQGGKDDLDADRFRMTFELDGCEPHEEDTWTGRRIAVGDAELEIGTGIPRCVITTLDQRTGRPDFPTLKVIAGYRDPLPDREMPFGMYATVTRPGTVSVGDAVTPG